MILTGSGSIVIWDPPKQTVEIDLMIMSALIVTGSTHNAASPSEDSSPSVSPSA
jgi:hypothetical protein